MKKEDYIEEIDAGTGFKRRCKHCGSNWYKGALEWHYIECVVQTNIREHDAQEKKDG